MPRATSASTGAPVNGNVGCCGRVSVRPSTLGLGLGLTVAVGSTDGVTVDVDVDVGRTVAVGDTVAVGETDGLGVGETVCGTTQAVPPCQVAITVDDGKTPFG